MTAWRISSWSCVASRGDLAQRPLGVGGPRQLVREWSSSSISRALVMAMAAWLASAPTRLASVSPNAPSVFE
jgi:hypothetical protein